MTDKIATEVAEQDFDRFVEEMDLDLETVDMDVEDLTAFNKQKRRIIRAIERGNLIINENGEAVYTPSNPKSKSCEPLVFHERSGNSMLVMDRKKKNADMSKTYAIMADMCKVHQSTFANLVGLDIKVCEAIYTLLVD